MAITHQPSCSDEVSPHLSVSQALERITQAVQPIAGYQQVNLHLALGRVLAEDIQSPMQVPSYTNSAMDGYAINAADLNVEGEQTLEQVGTVFAGHPYEQSIEQGQCVRIMTGAMLPQGVDTVIMQEHVEADGNQIKFNAQAHQVGQNVRLAGEDIHVGQVVLQAGKQILPPELGLLASLGIAEVKIKPRLRVAFFSTGDELCPVGQPLKSGQIYDSNRYQLFGVLDRLNVEVIDMGVIPDDLAQIQQAFTTASQTADVLITSGGVSVGDADYVKQVLDELGQINFWKIAMKPGHPLTFGTINQATFFGLPGNPVSSLVTFYQFVQPALQRMMGQTDIARPTWKVRCLSKLKKKKGRTEFQRGILKQADDGEWVVTTTGAQGSHMIRSMSEANCFIVLQEHQTVVNESEFVTVQPLAGLL
ncbi:gephyrin-like molybdotransferase Glp [Candidatus Albibeggiatoa sp. nov. NOAA]|uniref:molybdopterin molybdotransferase MoeA n=1 Tax=Candidatus Albibeggiatoa sp. nov. NOAA TaxID=3162724 RepID=UPI0032F8C6DF|nr:molybdopterin molybdotransferase MoeA [Thiotrichaceae bacterium]